jgi:hypothetical protein
MSLEQLQGNISLYKANPWLFTDDQVDGMERFAQEYDVPFKRLIEVEEQKQDSLIEQFTSGVVEGFTTLGWADDPKTEAGMIASSAGHLIGLMPAVAGMIFTGGATGLARLGAGSSSIVKGMASVGKFLNSPTAKSIPMRVGEATFGKIVSPAITKAGVNVGDYIKKGSTAADILKTSTEFGVMSAVSNIWEGPKDAMGAGLQGAIMGGVFGSISNFVNMGKLLNHKNPAIRKGSEDFFWNRITRASIGGGLSGGIAAAQDAPTSVVLYETLLGGFFDYRQSNSKIRAGQQYIDSFRNKENQIYGDIHLGKEGEMLKQSEFQLLDPLSQDYVKRHYVNHIGELYERRIGQLELFSESAKEATEVSNASVHLKEMKDRLDIQRQVKEAELKSKNEFKDLSAEDEAYAKFLALEQQDLEIQSAKEVGLMQEVVQYLIPDLSPRADARLKRLQEQVESLEKEKANVEGDELLAIEESQREKISEINKINKELLSQDAEQEAPKDISEEGQSVLDRMTDADKEEASKGNIKKIVDIIRGDSDIKKDMKEERDLARMENPDAQAELETPSNIREFMYDVQDHLGGKEDANSILTKIVDIYNEGVKNKKDKPFTLETFLENVEKQAPDYVPTPQLKRNMTQLFNRLNVEEKYEWVSFDSGKGTIGFNDLYDANMNRKVVSKPPSSDEVHFRNTGEFPSNFKVLEFKDHEIYDQILKPYDKKYNPETDAYDDAMQGVDWLTLSRNLARSDRYLKIPKGDTGVERIYPFHPNIRDLSGVSLDRAYKTYLKTMTAIDKEAKAFIDYDMKETLKSYGKLSKGEKDVAERLYKKSLLSNFLYEPNSQFPNVLKRVKYEPIVASESIPQFTDTKKFAGVVPEDGTIELILQDGMPNGKHTTNTEGIKHEHYWERRGKKGTPPESVPYPSEIDGYMTVHSALFEKILEYNGMDSETFSRLKPTIAAYVDGQLFILKGGIHTPQAEFDNAMGATNRAIVTMDAAKVVPKGSEVYSGFSRTNKKNENIFEFRQRGTKNAVPTEKLKPVKINLSDLRINYGVVENDKALKRQTIKKQFHVLLNELQVPREAFDAFMEDTFMPTIRGDENMNKVVQDLSANPDGEIPRSFDIRKIGDAQFIEIVNNPEHRLYRDLLADMVKETAYKELGDSFGEEDHLIELSDYTNRLQSWAKYSNFDPIVAMAEPDMYDAMILRYRKQKFMYPEWKYSASAWVAGNDPVTKLRHGAVKKDHFKLGHSYKKMPIKWGINSTKKLINGSNINKNVRETTLGEAWDLYNNPKTTKKEKEVLKDMLEMAFMRVPSGAVSGTRILQFDGFIENTGTRSNGKNFADHGVYMHPKDHFYIDGADVDGDKVFFYQGLNTDFKKAIKANKDELSIKQDGLLQKLASKDPNKNAEFKSDFPKGKEGEMLKRMYSSPIGQYLPGALRKVGKASYNGKQGMGAVVNAKTLLNYITADVINRGNGKVDLDVYTNGQKDGKIVLETDLQKLNDPDQGYRAWAVEAGQRTADSAEYWNMIGFDEMRDLLVRKAFRNAYYENANGDREDIAFRDLQNTMYGDLYNVNQKLYGKNYRTGRAWKTFEVQEAMESARNADYRMNSLLYLAKEMSHNKFDLKYESGNKQWRQLVNDFNDWVKTDPNVLRNIDRKKLIITPQYFKIDYEKAYDRIDDFYQRGENADLQKSQVNLEYLKNAGLRIQGGRDVDFVKGANNKYGRYVDKESRETILDERLKLLFDKMRKEEIIAPHDRVLEAKLKFNDVVDMFSAIHVDTKANALIKAMNDSGNSDVAYDFLNKIATRAINIKSDFRNARRSTYRKRLPSNVSMKENNDTLKDTKKRIYQEAKNYGIEPTLALDYFYNYTMSSLYNQTRSPQQTRNQIETWLTAEKKKAQRPKDEKNVDKNKKYMNPKAIEYWEGVLNNFNKWYHKTSFARWPLESSEIPERVKKEFMSGLAGAYKAIRSPNIKTTKQLSNEIADSILPEKIELNEANTHIKKARSAQIELERLVDPKFTNVSEGDIANIPEDIPRILKRLETDIRALPPEFSRSFEEMFAVYQMENSPTGFSRPISQATYDDIRGFQQFVRQIRVEGADSSRMKKLYFYMFPERIGEKQLSYDMSQMYKTQVPYIDQKGQPHLLDVKVPFSTFKYLNTSFGHIYTMENAEKERNQEYIQRFYSLRDQILGLDNGTTEFAKIHRIAVAKMLKIHGAGKAGDEQSNKIRQEYYQKLYDEQLPEYEALQGKKYTVTEDGKKVTYTTDQLIDWIGEKHGQFLEEHYRKWVIADTKDGKSIWENVDDLHQYGKYDKLIEFLPSGRLNMNRIRKYLLEPAAQGDKNVILDLIENTSLSNETMYRIQYETILERHIANKGIARDSNEARDIREKMRKRFYKDKDGADQWRQTAFQPIGYVGTSRATRSNAFEYFPQMGHMNTRKSRREVREFISNQLDLLTREVDSLIGDLKEGVDINYDNYSIRKTTMNKMRGDIGQFMRGKIDEKTLIDRFLALEEAGYETFLGNRVSEDGGASEHAFKWLSANHNDSYIEKFNLSKPGSGKSRGENPMPGFSLDFDVIDSYSNSWISAFYKNLTGILAHDRITDFAMKNSYKNKEDVPEWTNFMQMYARDVLGQPSTFTEDMIGLNKQQVDAFKQRIKTIEAMPDELISNAEIDELALKKKLLKRNKQRSKIRKTAYYGLSDQVMGDFLDKVSIKLGGKNGPKLPFLGELPKSEEARKFVLRKAIQNFGAFEAKWSLISLLSHPKTAIGNLLGGNTNTISNNGLRHFIKAKDTAHLYSIFKGAKLRDGTEISPDNVKQWMNRFAEESGALESFIVSEASLERGFRGKKMKGFLKDYIDELQKDWNMPDQTLYDIAKKHGINRAIVDGGAWFMRKSERMLRRDSFVSHYLNAREILEQIIPDMKHDNPFLIKFAVKGVEATQFLYHSSARPAFSRTAVGKIMTRFMPFAWNSIRFRRVAWNKAKVSGFDINTPAGKRLQRQLSADMLTFALANIFVSSIFDSALPPPMSYMQDTADWLFGDEKQRERAFFNQWPHPALAPLSTITGPSMRYILAPTKALINNDWEPFLNYHAWAMAPFGRLARSMVRTYDVPELWVEEFTGLPIHNLARKKKKAEKKKEEERLAEENVEVPNSTL